VPHQANQSINQSYLCFRPDSRREKVAGVNPRTQGPATGGDSGMVAMVTHCHGQL